MEGSKKDVPHCAAAAVQSLGAAVAAAAKANKAKTAAVTVLGGSSEVRGHSASLNWGVEARTEPITARNSRLWKQHDAAVLACWCESR